MTDPALLATTLRFLDGGLSAAETRVLAGRLEQPGEERRRVALLLLQIAHLHELGLEEHRSRPRLVLATAAPPASFRRRRAMVALAGAALAVGALLLFWPRHPTSGPTIARRESAPASPNTARWAGRERRWWPDPPAPGQTPRAVGRLAAASGNVRLIDDRPAPLRPGASLLDGQGLETVGTGARAVLEVAGGARLEVEGNALLLAVASDASRPGAAHVPDRVLLERGSMQVDLSAAAEDLSVVSPLVEVRGRGSQFRLAAAAGELRVFVDRGQVTMIRLPDGHRLTVEAGAAAMMTESQALAIPPPPRPVALLVVGSWPVPRATGTDAALQGRLERLGYAVQRVRDTKLDKAALADKALVVLSPSIAGAVVRDRLPNSGLRDLPLPIVNCEIEAMPSLGMTTATGMRRARTQLSLQASGHPLAGGLAGNVRVTDSPAPLMWGKPTPEATVIATLDDEESPAVFGYDTGTRMNGLLAPARRVSCFLSELATIQASEAGWQLFDSAVRWAGPVKR